MAHNILLANEEEARDYLHHLYAHGFDLFRGQRKPWSILPSLFRGTEQDKSLAISRLQRFLGWCRANWRLCIYDEEQLRGIAQHYGIATNLIDVTRSVDVALFFAQDSGSVHDSPCSTVFAWRSDVLKCIPDIDIVEEEIPNLWRLEAQQGLFISFRSEASLNLDGSQAQVIQFPSTKHTVDTSTRQKYYPIRKSQLEVLIDDYFYREHRDELRASRSKLASTYSFISFIANFPSIRSYGLAFQGRDWLSTQTADRSALLKWLEEKPPSYSYSASEKPRQVVLAKSSHIHRDIQLAVAFWDSGLGRPQFELSLFKNDQINAQLSKIFNWLFDGITSFPFSSANRRRCLENTFKLLRVLCVDDQGKTVRAELQRVLGQYCSVHFAPNDSFRRCGFASIRSLERAVNDDAYRSLLRFFRDRIAANRREITCFEVKPALAFTLNRFVSLFAEEVIPSQVLTHAELCQSTRWKELPPWQVVFDPLSLIYFTVNEYRNYPFGYEDKLCETLFLFKGMLRDDVKEQIRVLANKTKSGESNFSLRLHGFSDDSREIWEIDEALRLLRYFYDSGGVRLLSAFTMTTFQSGPLESDNTAGETLPESDDSDGYFPNVYRAGLPLSAFDVWLMVQGHWGSLQKHPEQDLRPFMLRFYNDLPICEAALQNALST